MNGGMKLKSLKALILFLKKQNLPYIRIQHDGLTIELYTGNNLAAEPTIPVPIPMPHQQDSFDTFKEPTEDDIRFLSCG